MTVHNICNNSTMSYSFRGKLFTASMHAGGNNRFLLKMYNLVCVTWHITTSTFLATSGMYGAYQSLPSELLLPVTVVTREF